MGRIIHIAPTGPDGPARWVKVAGAVVVGVALGIALTEREDEPPVAARPVAPAAAVPRQAAEVGPVTAGATALMAQNTPSLSPCPLQSLQLAVGDSPVRTVCLDATQVQQTGSVRSYVVRAGDAQGWTLGIDMVERRVTSVSLRSRDGREFRCERPDCAGDVALSVSSAGGAGSLTLRDLRLAGPSEAVLTASLRVPSDDQLPGLACSGPTATISSPSGSMRRFCGQGGAGVEIVDDGNRHYRFQDHEGRTLAIAVDAAQRVTTITWDGHGCVGRACSGASTSSADPANDLAERSFFFGRTPLSGPVSGPATHPALILDGSLVMPAQ